MGLRTSDKTREFEIVFNCVRGVILYTDYVDIVFIAVIFFSLSFFCIVKDHSVDLGDYLGAI